MNIPVKGPQMPANLVDTSGLPRSIAAAASSVDDDAQSVGVIAAPAASASDQQSSEHSNTNNSIAPIHSIAVVEETTTSRCNTSSTGNSSKINNSNSNNNSNKSESEKLVMNDADSTDVNEVTDNTKSISINVDVDVDVDIDIDNNNNNNNNNNNDENNMSDDDESEYEYEDDDDAAFTGFLVTDNTYGPTSSVNANNNHSNGNGNTAASSSSLTAPARIVEEETVAAAASSAAAWSSTSANAVAVPTPRSPRMELEPAPRKKWREPSRAAVSMSLRAQQETSGSKRRLAQDLYRIMNQDTEEAGFSIAPQSEDSMERWTIKLFQFDPDSNLAKDMLVVGIDHVALEMKFPEQYPFEPPFVRVVKPRFKRQTGFVMNGALCMELLTKDGWNPINDIESVIVSIRSLLVVGDGRLQAVAELSKARYESLLATAQQEKQNIEDNRDRDPQSQTESRCEPEHKKARTDIEEKKQSGLPKKNQGGSYTATEAQSAYSHLSDYHKKKGWDTSGWWARKG